MYPMVMAMYNGIVESSQLLAQLAATGSFGGGGGTTPAPAPVNVERDMPIDIEFPMPVIGTYLDTADSSSQATHAGLAVAPNGVWNGFRYWGVHTPYKGLNDQKEVPFLICANDPFALPGKPGAWQTPPGVTNPVVAPHPQYLVGVRFASDPSLAWDPDGLRLHMIWRYSDTSIAGGLGVSDVWTKSTTDGGKTWTVSTKILSANNALSITSPGFFWDAAASLWRMYFVDNVGASPKKIYRVSSASMTSGWDLTTALECTVTGYAPGREPWHLDAIKHNGKVYLTIMDRATGDVATGGCIMGVCNGDGLTFRVSGQVMPSQSWARTYYRASAAVDDGRWLLLFSARNVYVGTGNLSDNRIGCTGASLPEAVRTKVTLADDFARSLGSAAVAAPAWPVLGGDTMSRVLANVTTLQSGQTVTNRIGTGLQSTATGFAPVDASLTHVGWAPGANGVYYQASFSAITATTGELWMTFKGSGTNCWRAGFKAGGGTGLLVEAVTGATPTLVAGATRWAGLAAYRPGILIGVCQLQNTIAITVDGIEVLRFDTTQYSGQTEIGIGATGTGSKMRGAWWRELLAAGA